MPTRPLIPGDQVRVTRGAFESMVGVVLRPEAPTTQVWVEARIFGRAVPVVVEPEQIELLDGDRAGGPST